MKLRLGFVSNSSSSSFCIYGAIVSDKDIINMVKSIGLKELDLQDKFSSMEDFLKEAEDNYGTVDNYELAYVVAAYLGLESHRPYNDDVYMGRSFSEIKDNETGYDFKKSVRDKLEPLGIEDFASFKEAWRD